MASRKHSFVTLYVDLTNKCNLVCPWCPNAHPRFRNQKKLYFSNNHWTLLLDQLADMNYSGRFTPYTIADGLVVPDLEEKVSQFREACPRSQIIMDTNGYRLTPERLVDLVVRGVNHFTINVYDPARFDHFTEVMSRAVKILEKEGVNFVWKDQTMMKAGTTQVTLNVRHRLPEPGVWWNNKAGWISQSLPGIPRHELPRPMSCVRPFRNFMFDVYGDVRLCGNDWGTEINLGNIEDAPLEELFNCKQRAAYQLALLARDRDIPLCDMCTGAGGSYKHLLRLSPAAEAFTDVEHAKRHLRLRYPNIPKNVDDE